MQAVILIAGKATRTYPLTLTRPKALLKLANKTLLEHNLEQLENLVDEVILVAGYKKKMIENFLKDRHQSRQKIIFVEQKECLGTGHALLQTEKFLKDRFILLLGDDIYDKIGIELCIKHKYSVLAERVKDPSRFGVFILENNMVKGFAEKSKNPPSNITNSGLFVLDRKIFTYLKSLKKSERGEYEVTDALKEMSKNENIFCEISNGYWLSAGHPRDLLNVNRKLLEKRENQIKGMISENVIMKGKVIIEEEAEIDHDCVIEGPVIIGKKSKISQGSHIGSNTSIGDSCKISDSCRIKNSIIADGTEIGNFSIIEGSIIGNDVKTEDYIILASGENEPIIIGDKACIGEKVRINAGVKIWPNKKIEPNRTIEKDII